MARIVAAMAMLALGNVFFMVRVLPGSALLSD
jgi:hypothetical protein